jgi:preprotein translocase subunit YajC
VSALPLIILAALVLGMLFFAQRNRQKAAAAEVQRRTTIGVGTDVMTTSGLYGTVTAINEDGDTVLLSIAPGVEVKFTFAALRDAASLPAQYRGGTTPYSERPYSERSADEAATPTEPDDARPDRPAPERPDA